MKEFSRLSPTEMISSFSDSVKELGKLRSDYSNGQYTKEEYKVLSGKIKGEISGKMLEIGASDLMTPVISSNSRPQSFDEALAALSMLGFQKSASEKVLNAIFKEDPRIGVEDAIRTALKSL